jgi:hypothetical protein
MKYCKSYSTSQPLFSHTIALILLVRETATPKIKAVQTIADMKPKSCWKVGDYKLSASSDQQVQYKAAPLSYKNNRIPRTLQPHGSSECAIHMDSLSAAEHDLKLFKVLSCCWYARCVSSVVYKYKAC